MKNWFRREPEDWRDWFRSDPRDTFNAFIAFAVFCMGMTVVGIFFYAIYRAFETFG